MPHGAQRPDGLLLSGERIVAMLDEFFEVLTAAATAHQAMIDKLIGDAIMLVFGIPSARGDETLRALSTAAAMHCGFDALLARWPTARLRTLPLGLAIGIANGDAVLANVGSATRMDYTVIGRPVSLAARLTAAACAGETLASASVRTAASATGSDTTRFGRVRSLVLKGFRGRVAAYPVRSTASVARPHAPATLVDPVCGMKLAQRQALAAHYGGATYHFCSLRCRAAFRRDPLRFITSARRRG